MKLFIYITHGSNVDAKTFRHNVGTHHAQAIVLTAVSNPSELDIQCNQSILNTPPDDLLAQVDWLKSHYRLARQDIFLYIDSNYNDIGGKSMTAAALQYIEKISPEVVVFFTATPVCRESTNSWIKHHNYPMHPLLYQEQQALSVDVEGVCPKLSLSPPPIFAVLDKKQCMSSLSQVANIEEVLSVKTLVQVANMQEVLPAKDNPNTLARFFCCKKGYRIKPLQYYDPTLLSNANTAFN